MHKKILVVVNILFIIIASSCSGAEKTQNEIDIKNAWARPAMQGNTSAIYFLIENNRVTNVKLISVDSSIAELTEIHLSKNVDGTMKMEKQEFIEIESNKTVEFKPGSYHVMLINLNKNLNVGDQFEVSLSFDNSEVKNISVEVKETE
jgi:copper(I)-binding protein